MENTLVKNSNIGWIKTRFFINRALIYTLFLLIPILVPKSVDFGFSFQCLMIFSYILFVVSQWFMLGKEIDHLLHIYFRTNSSMDRVIYRLLLGMTSMMLFFNILSLFPDKWTNNFFWTTWVIMGIFYSWPTRGKIIKESVTTSFSEFKYLDAFEKTVLFLIGFMFIVSLPDFPQLNSRLALKLFFDPAESLSPVFWNFLTVNYFPFYNYPELFKIAWSMHFYVVGTGLFLITCYALFRFFVSRRLSVLGIFAVISTWSFSKFLASNYGDAILTTYSILWVWYLLWASRAASYRAGFCFGLLGMYLTLLTKANFLLIIFQTFISYHFLFKAKTRWFRSKWIRYTAFGSALAFIFLFFAPESHSEILTFNKDVFRSLLTVFERKAFYWLAPFGLAIIFISRRPKSNLLNYAKVNDELMLNLFMSLLSILFIAMFFNSYIIKNFGWVWILTLFSLFPLEAMFQAGYRHRNSRNIIYLSYILICLLDSHVEGRIKIFLKMFY